MTHHNHQRRTIHSYGGHKPYASHKHLAMVMIMENVGRRKRGGAENRGHRYRAHGYPHLHAAQYSHIVSLSRAGANNAWKLGRY